MGGKFIDTNVFVALFVADDSLHEKAKQALALISRPYLVHEYVAIETTTVLLVRAGKTTADMFLEGVLGNADFEFVPTSENSFQTSANAFLAAQSKLSFTDATLLSLSKNHEVLTFDEALQKAIKRQKN